MNSKLAAYFELTRPLNVLITFRMLQGSCREGACGRTPALYGFSPTCFVQESRPTPACRNALWRAGTCLSDNSFTTGATFQDSQ